MGLEMGLNSSEPAELTPIKKYDDFKDLYGQLDPEEWNNPKWDIEDDSIFYDSSYVGTRNLLVNLQQNQKEWDTKPRLERFSIYSDLVHQAAHHLQGSQFLAEGQPDLIQQLQSPERLNEIIDEFDRNIDKKYEHEEDDTAVQYLYVMDELGRRHSCDLLFSDKDIRKINAKMDRNRLSTRDELQDDLDYITYIEFLLGKEVSPEIIKKLESEERYAATLKYLKEMDRKTQLWALGRFKGSKDTLSYFLSEDYYFLHSEYGYDGFKGQDEEHDQFLKTIGYAEYEKKEDAKGRLTRTAKLRIREKATNEEIHNRHERNWKRLMASLDSQQEPSEKDV